MKFAPPAQGFVQPLQPHEHWHTDFSHVNVGGTFYYLCSVLDGCSRAIVAWDIRAQMHETDAEIVLQEAREAHPEAKPRIISDRGAQFVSRDFQTFNPPLADHPRPHLAPLPAEQRQAGALPPHPAHPGRCQAHRRRVHRSL